MSATFVPSGKLINKMDDVANVLRTARMSASIHRNNPYDPIAITNARTVQSKEIAINASKLDFVSMTATNSRVTRNRFACKMQQATARRTLLHARCPAEMTVQQRLHPLIRSY
jgi:hypothetical protein